jgi:release factor glutamine methyltransferase
MAATETWTVKRLLEWTTEYLAKAQSESPRLDAELLLADARQCQRIELYTQFDAVADEPQRTAFRELVRRRAEGTPVAYLLGRREFYSLSFRVTPDVLIPRPETEFVVVTLLDLVRDYQADQPLQIADVGTGSGILAVCAAREVPTAQIMATDISPAAIEVARSNAADHGVADRIDFVRADLLDGVPATRQFDFVISNPPYVSHQEFEQLPTGVKDHEPRQALDGGPDGTSVISRLATEAAKRLTPGGWLLCEISPMIHAKVKGLLKDTGQLESVSTINDLAHLPRVIIARKCASDQQQT